MTAKQFTYPNEEAEARWVEEFRLEHGKVGFFSGA